MQIPELIHDIKIHMELPILHRSIDTVAFTHAKSSSIHRSRMTEGRAAVQYQHPPRLARKFGATSLSVANCDEMWKGSVMTFAAALVLSVGVASEPERGKKEKSEGERLVPVSTILEY